MLIGAALLDRVDGAVARKLGLTEPLENRWLPHHISFGSILDDIADAVSFCIAPAWIFYLCFSDASDPIIQQLPTGFVALCYAVLGIARLVFFTRDRTPIPGFFKGMPAPAAALLVVAPLIIFTEASHEVLEWVRFLGIFCFGLMIGAALLMNLYPVRYLHLGRFMGRHPWFARVTILLVLVFAFTPYFGYIAFLYLFLYLLSPLVSWRIKPDVAARETQTKTDTPQ